MANIRAQQQYSLRWNNYLRHITFAFDDLKSNGDLVDVTLCCDGQKIKAHKVLLSACSAYFKEIFKDNPHPHPVIVFKFIKFEDLNAIIQFIYQGEVNVQQDTLQSFLQTAELLAIQVVKGTEIKFIVKIKSNIPELRNVPDIMQQNANEQRTQTVEKITAIREYEISEDPEIVNEKLHPVSNAIQMKIDPNKNISKGTFTQSAEQQSDKKYHYNWFPRISKYKGLESFY
ncbi:modifier of mdg4-like [Condylostylus longicornis]|uniref:modifier of mdg4-like n=1 Tax=Condylostylus longicornis TaxID=2530218 RepID=UPI00244DDAC8|nr:modifier of mdg4-like [Condylostylus longicornis]